MRGAASRVDGNHKAIVQALRKVGAVVLSLHTLGHGAPDLLVWYRRKLTMLEIKTARGRLTEDEIAFAMYWPVVIVRSIDDALVAIGARAA